MTSRAGHILWALGGALVGGVIGWLAVPAFFWAALLGGAMTGAALRVGYLLGQSGGDATDGE